MLIGCNPGIAEDNLYDIGYIVVNEQTWSENNATPYPFTVTEGKISCGYNPGFGREVYFDPQGYTDESYFGTPLNKPVVDALKQADMSTNVPYNIKEDADLSDAIQI